MEDKKIVELPDEALDAVAGGSGNGGNVVVTCTSCRVGKVSIPKTGFTAETCPNCGATLICSNGRLQYCIPAQQPTTPDVDTDDSWL